MVHPYKSGTDQRLPSVISPYILNPNNLTIVILSLDTQRTISPETNKITMPKAKQKSVTEEVEDDTPLHGVINEEEAKTYRKDLDKILENLAKNIQDNVGNAMELAVKELINRIADHIPSTEEVDPVGILNTIRDPSCLILRNPTEEAIEKLEEVDPDADIPRGEDMVQEIEKMGTLNEQQKHDIGEIFKNLEIAHEYLGRSCGLMAGLSRNLTSKQLILLMKNTIRPLIQINIKEGLLDEPVAGTSREGIIGSEEEKILNSLTPSPSSELIKKEKENSRFRLIAATLAFKIMNKFTTGTSQRKMHERYHVKPKQLALYITGRRYLGGSDRKRRLSEQEEGTPKKSKT